MKKIGSNYLTGGAVWGITLLMAFATQAEPQLLAHWSFDSANGNTYFDVTGHGYDASSFNVGVTDGIMGTALSLPGSGYDMAIANSATNFNFTAFSVETWFYSNRSLVGQTYPHCIILTYSTFSSGVAHGFSVLVDLEGQLHFALANQDGTSWEYVDSQDSIIQSNKWYHLTATYDGSTMRVYVNGTLTNSLAHPGGFSFAHDNARIGNACETGGTPSWFIDGKLDELKVYNYALNADSIAAHYNFDKSNSPMVVAHWSFDSANGNTYYDVTGHGYDASSPNIGVTDGVEGRALSLPGGGYDMTIANSANNFNYTAFSVETWFYSNRSLVGQSYPHSMILTYSTFSSGVAHGFSVLVDLEGQLHFALASQNGATWEYVDSQDSIIQPKRWYHLVATYDGTSMRVFVNGTLTNSLAHPGGFSFAHDNARIGNACETGGTPSWFIDGKLDELKVYNYAVSPDTIRRYYESHKPNQKEINLGMQTLYAQPGDEVWVPLYLANHEDALKVSAFQFALVIDTTVITFEDAITDIGIAKDWGIAKNSKQDTVYFAMGGMSQEVGYGEGELLRCKFRVKSGTKDGDFSNITIQKVVVDDDATMKINTTPGKIIVDVIGILYGDVSGNAKVNAFDGAKILQYVVGSLALPDTSVPNFNEQVADVSANGSVTCYDAALIFQYSIGLISQFPADQGLALCKPNQVNTDTLAELSLVVSQSDQSQTVYELRGNKLRGYVAGQFCLTYNPDAVQLEIGELGSAIRNSVLESHLDITNRKLNVALTTNDDIDSDSSISLLKIVVPPVVAGTKVDSALLLKDAQINEGHIAVRLRNLNTTYAIHHTPPRKGIFTQMAGAYLQIHNPDRKPLSAVIFDLRGRQLYAQSSTAAQPLECISLKRFPTGVYVTKIRIGATTNTSTFVVGR